jgi:hypothetical protein
MLKIFGIPAALAVASAVGLVAALLWDGGRELLALAAAALPLAALALAIQRGED